MIVLICPRCDHMHLTINKDGSISCDDCGYEGKEEQFQERVPDRGFGEGEMR